MTTQIPLNRGDNQLGLVLMVLELNVSSVVGIPRATELKGLTLHSLCCHTIKHTVSIDRLDRLNSST
jgi:hypothetical protein